MADRNRLPVQQLPRRAVPIADPPNDRCRARVAVNGARVERGHAARVDRYIFRIDGKLALIDLHGIHARLHAVASGGAR